jgi:hypothetical protein
MGTRRYAVCALKEGDLMGTYVELANRALEQWGAEKDGHTPPESAKPQEPPFVQRMRALQKRRPDYVGQDEWEQAVDNGFRFAVDWLSTAEDLGWSVDDLAALPMLPEKPHPTYRRLSKYDEVGLIWLLRGRPVKALTADTAAIGTPGGGTVTFHRRR